MFDIINTIKKYGSVIYISSTNLKKNYLLLQNIVKPAKLAAVVKSNAYGIGLKDITRILTEVKCKDFFVATLDEALIVRKISQHSNIFVLHGVLCNNHDIFVKYNIIPVINSVLQLQQWIEYAKKINQKLNCIIHIDTGMYRLGLTKDEVIYVINTFTDFKKCLNIKYVMSHLACSSDNQDIYNKIQLENFIKIVKKYFNGYKYSLSSSYGVFFGKQYHFDLVRVGFSLYGSNPTPKNNNPLFPVIQFYSSVLKINSIKKGEGIGYDHEWHATQDSLIATVSVGYSDGIFINYNKNAGLYINNEKVPLIGRVSMDSLMIDISNMKSPVKEGDIVEIIGNNQNIDEFAIMNNTNNCQALNILSLRYPRIYY